MINYQTFIPESKRCQTFKYLKSDEISETRILVLNNSVDEVNFYIHNHW